MKPLKWLKSINNIVFPFIVIFIITGCTWTPRNILPKYFRTIYVNAIENSTSINDLDKMLYDSLVSEFELDGRLTVTPNVGNADGILFTEIETYKVVPISYTETGEPDGHRIIMRIYMRVRDLKSREYIREKEFEETTEFYLKSKPVETELEARERLIKEIARKIVSKTIEGW